MHKHNILNIYKFKNGFDSHFYKMTSILTFSQDTYFMYIGPICRFNRKRKRDSQTTPKAKRKVDVLEDVTNAPDENISESFAEIPQEGKLNFSFSSLENVKKHFHYRPINCQIPVSYTKVT